MSVYSRWVEARGTITIESMPALRHGSKPVFSLALGVGRLVGRGGVRGERRAAAEEVRIDAEAVLRLDGERRDGRLDAVALQRTAVASVGGPRELVERDHRLDARVGALDFRDRGGAERVADDREPDPAARGDRLAVLGAIPQ